jgi:RNA polymerase sigma-70 factor (ECF subfamily)
VTPLPSPYDSPEALEDLLERIRPRLKKVLRSYDIPVQDAEDVLQDTFLEAFRKWDTILYKDIWLIGAVRFKCSNYWKKQRAERLLGVDPPVLEELSPPQSPGQEQEEIRHDLRSLTRGLGARHRAVLWLRFGVGLSTGEIAERLGYCPSSIRKLSGRCLARLRRWAGAAPGPDGPDAMDVLDGPDDPSSA